MKQFINKYLTRRNRNIIAIVVIILGIGFMINYSFFEPSYINEYIATNIYSEPANSYFDDENFYNCVVDAYNYTHDDVTYTTSLSDEELKTITRLECSNQEIVSTKGIDKLTSLTYLDLEKNKLTSIDLSNNVLLQTIDLSYNQLTYLDISNCTKVVTLSVINNFLTNLDVFGFDSLKQLYAYGNQLNDIKLGGNVNLLDLHLGTECVSNGFNGITYSCGNQLSNIDVSEAILLEKLSIVRNNLTSLDVSSNSSLKELSISKNKLTNLKVDGADSLKIIYAINNQLKSLDVSNNLLLTKLYVSENQLQDLDVSNNTLLTLLDVDENDLTELNVSGATALTQLSADSNQLISLDVSNNLLLDSLSVAKNQLQELDVSSNKVLTFIDVSRNNLLNLDLSNNTGLTYLNVENNELSELDVSKNILLKQLYILGNKITSIDLSNNTQLVSSYYDIRSSYCETLYVYNGNTIIANNQVKPPNGMDWIDPTWRSEDINIADVNQDGLVTTFNSGTVSIIGTAPSDVSSNSYKYITTSIVNVVEITSDKYIIDEENSYILLGSDNDIDNIKSNINVSHDNVTIDVDLNGYKLYIKYEDEVLKEFDIIGFSSEEYDLSKDYIYVGSNELDLNKITTINCDKELTDDKLIIKLGEEIVKEYSLIGITSDKHDLDNDYIYVGFSELNLDDITTINCDKEINDNKLLIKLEEEIIKEYNIVSISSELYDLSKEYIYVGTDNIDIDGINVINGTSIIEDNKLVIKYNDEVLDEYLLVSISSEKYDLNKNHIYTGSKSFDSSKINIINGSSEVTDDKFIIKYNDYILYEYPIIKIYSDVYEVTDDYIHTKDGNFKHELMLSNYELSMTLMDKLVGESYRATYIEYKYEDEVVANFLLIMYWSDTYNLENDYIYVGTSDLDLSLIKNNCTDISFKIEDNILKINYNEKTVREIKILSIKFNNYNISDKNILVSSDVSYKEFITNIEVNDGITYKLYNGEEEVTSGNIEKDMIIKIYYEDEEIDEYFILDEYLEFDDSLDIDMDNSIINKIDHGTLIDDITSKINTSGQVSVLDKNGNLLEDITNKKIGTGYKFKIDMTGNIFEYIASVRGDINGDGLVNINDVVGVSRHVIMGNYLEGLEYINASDINSDDKVDINDVIRLAKHIVNNSEL